MTKLKYDFIDDQHERMHNALIAAGWTCDNDAMPYFSNKIYKWVYTFISDNIFLNDIDLINHIDSLGSLLRFDKKTFSEVADILEQEMEDKQPKDFSHINVGQWVKSKLDNKWYQREKGRLKDFLSSILWFRLENNQYCGSQYPQNWDLTDIRDTNPDQPLEMQEDQEHYPINKDNIVEVLEYNGFKSIAVNNYSTKYKKEDHVFYVPLQKHEHLGYGYLQNEEDYYNCPQIIHPNLYKVLDFMSEFCLLEPLPKFDFVQYLLDNGWTSNNYNSECISSKRKTMMIVIKDYKFHHYDNSKQLYDCSEYNAKILVEMSNFGEKFQVSKELS